MADLHESSRIFRDISETHHKLSLRLHFCNGADRDSEILIELARRGPGCTFSNVRRDRYGSASHLSCQAISFTFRKGFSLLVDHLSQVHGGLPCSQVSVGSFSSHSPNNDPNLSAFTTTLQSGSLSHAVSVTPYQSRVTTHQSRL